MADNCRVAAVDSILGVELVQHRVGPGNQVELMGCKAGWGMVELEAARHMEADTVGHTAEELVAYTAARTEPEGHYKGMIQERQQADQASTVVDTVLN